MDLIPKSLDAQVMRPTNEVDASMTRIYRIFGKFSAINGFDKPLPTTTSSFSCEKIKQQRVSDVDLGFLANPQPSTDLTCLYRLPFESGLHADCLSPFRM
uniref:Uncharacterized protein n=1 Tax=Asparagus officinalis TaxID=4686 RepID=Q2AA82_ASPOF|nr:hypothetical protein 18.t00002 [Asparagus officinalis]